MRKNDEKKSNNAFEVALGLIALYYVVSRVMDALDVALNFFV